MFGPTQVAASIRTRVVLSDTSDTCPPITPAMPDGPSASHTSAVSGPKLRSTPSERRHRLALASAAHHDP